jgi:hypothetical protein
MHRDKTKQKNFNLVIRFGRLVIFVLWTNTHTHTNTEKYYIYL